MGCFQEFVVLGGLLSLMEFNPKFPVPLVLEILTCHQVAGTTLKSIAPVFGLPVGPRGQHHHAGHRPDQKKLKRWRTGGR